MLIMACGGNCGCEAGYCRVDELQALVDKMKSSCKDRTCTLEKSEQSDCNGACHHCERGNCEDCSHRHCEKHGGEPSNLKTVELSVQGLEDADVGVELGDSIVTGLFTFEMPESSNLKHPGCTRGNCQCDEAPERAMIGEINHGDDTED